MRFYNFSRLNYLLVSILALSLVACSGGDGGISGTDSASNNAKKAIKYKEENGSSCGTKVGWTRARQLADKKPISRDTIARMASFKRHQQHKDVPYSEGCGGIMYDAWGGTSGIEWAIRKLEQIDRK